jgi:hypothetical protein
MTTERKPFPHEFGEIFRFITPILVTIAIFVINGVDKKVDKLDSHFTNHLQHHQELEVGYEKRLSCIESKQRMVVQKVFKENEQ